MRHLFIICVLFATTSRGIAQTATDSVYLKRLYDESLTRGRSYEDLRYLCKEIGHRLSGSVNAARAVEWGKELMVRYGFDSVWLQPVLVPHWERGSNEAAWVHSADTTAKLHVSALGGSVGTKGILRAELIEAKSIEHLRELGAAVKDKIVFLNQPMDPTQIQTFRAYGGCYPIRGDGASVAAEYGAKGVIIRSLTLAMDFYPHTGSLWYADSNNRIPAAAVSTRDAVLIKRLLRTSKKVEVSMNLSCEYFGLVPSFNVIGEITGSSLKNEFITTGGHLDSWDLGEGAHDDGAGVIHTLEAVRLLKVTGYKPRRTIRVVWFMNEENGNYGGKMYAHEARRKGEIHYAALESDRGGFVPRGFSMDGTARQLMAMQSFAKLFEPYGLHVFEKGYGGVDIGPLKDGKIALMGFVPDSQRYFDHHHAASDVFETVNKRELELGAASVAAMLFLIDKYGLEKTITEP
jgi:hypothetical protein